MDDEPKIQRYLNNFRKNLSPYLKSGVGVTSTVYPSTGPGAVLEFSVGENLKSDDRFENTQANVNASLDTVNQTALVGTENLTFSGTSTVVQAPNRFIIIKGGDSEEQWGEEATKNDVRKLLKNIRK